MTKNIFFIKSSEDDGSGYAIVATSLNKAKMIAMREGPWYDGYINIKGRKLDIPAKNLPIGILESIQALKIGAYSGVSMDCSNCGKEHWMDDSNLIDGDKFLCDTCIEEHPNI
jgi:hypothetical protein